MEIAKKSLRELFQLDEIEGARLYRKKIYSIQVGGKFLILSIDM
jgi:hypothetical protein